MRLTLAICAIVIYASSACARASTIALTLDGADQDGGDFTGADITLGWEFTVSSPFTVTELGIWDSIFSGLAQSHAVGIWDGSGDLLVSGTVPSDTSAADFDTFRFVAVAETPLPIGNYYIGAEYASTSSDYAALYVPLADITTAPQIAFLGNFYAASSNGLTFPSNPGNPEIESYFGPDFQFVPELSGLELTSIGLAALAVWRLIRSSRKQRV